MSEALETRRLDDYRWLIPRQGGMRVDGLVFADDTLMEDIRGDEAVQQVANVAHLPGIVGRSIGMPDIHWGYGFAIGGVAAFDPEEGGVVSPGGVGYDINCGVRLLRTKLTAEEVRQRLARLMDALYDRIPAGVGRGYERFRLSPSQIRSVLERGAEWPVSEGYGEEGDLHRMEAGGRIDGADPDQVSDRAVQRGRDQLGTVGSGNHFIELGYVDEVYDAAAAARLGLEPDTVTVFIHSGSRGLGYQVCDDYIQVMLEAVRRYDIELPDRQLVCAPLDSPEAGRYMGAMSAAANYAFANRQMMAHRVREVFADVFGRPWQELGIGLVYDVAHNIAKWETHEVDGRERRLCVHRKGATRAFPPGHPELPAAYRDLGQPVFIPGDMGRYSYVLLGTDGAYSETFGSTCHGAGRRMSRRQAKKTARGRDLRAEFEERGIEVRASSFGTVAEEIPEAYKDVADVVDVVDRAGIGRKVARLRPMGVLKG
ncbi:MAG: RNA-splicing ligase RtcB [Gemmatimonadetes bacterium]|nr:RtcB family protein [Gemmatimonadota bacterium]NIQ54229.1 RtcB family protein [Gemmatimonadota bacterium]NIU74437.1 RNA-splicing ligase RtcB [Gammaproteobacteria bacterium]NIX44417.1 RNA-splicing ligase RtcB [Gemmatimonadota bacterium]NIY08639.1 RNA-splicing ligase RtcB [Gemmatimonadota bacterium]